MLGDEEDLTLSGIFTLTTVLTSVFTKNQMLLMECSIYLLMKMIYQNQMKCTCKMQFQRNSKPWAVFTI